MPVFLLNHHIYLDDHAPEFALYNQAFKYGDGLFETIRIYKGKPLFLHMHFLRLFTGMYFLKYRFQEEQFQAKVMEGLYRVMASQSYYHARIRIQVYRRALLLPPEIIIESQPIEDYYAGNNRISVTDYKQTPLFFSPLSSFKLSNRVTYQLANLYAKEQKVEEAVLFSNGKVSETANFNVFIVKDKKVITPPLTSACVNGIMRGQVMRLCETMRIPIKEKNITEKELLQCDEMFVTNVVRGVVGVERYNEVVWENPMPPITGFLKQTLQQVLEDEA